MQNGLFADAIAQVLTRFASDFEVYLSDSPDQTEELCVDGMANLVLMEAVPFGSRSLEARLRLRDRLRCLRPACSIVLFVDEKTDPKLAENVRTAKKDGLIDQFIYSSISSEYLSALIDTLC